MVFVGGIGMDERAEKLKSLLEKCGVITQFVYVKDRPTGSCAALVLGAQRCLCADIGAANVCRPEHVFSNDALQLQSSLNFSPVVYLEGYFITHSFDTALRVAQHCRANGKLFIFNLCGSYVCQYYSHELYHLLPFVDILFGYTEEYKSLQKFVDIDGLCDKFSCEESNIVHDIKRILIVLSGENTTIKKTKNKKYFSGNGEIELDKRENCFKETSLNGVKADERRNSFNEDSFTNGIVIEINGRRNSLNEESLTNGINGKSLTKETNGVASNHISEKDSVPWQAVQHNKLVVVTQGPSPLLYTKGRCIFERPVAPLRPCTIVDTTGAGDSFVGGFLAAAASGEDLETCLDCGVWAAQQLLREKGCTIPSKPATFL